jgi:hypothetical protein
VGDHKDRPYIVCQSPVVRFSIGDKTFKVHLDGYNQLPMLTGQQPKGARTDFAYFNDDDTQLA